MSLVYDMKDKTKLPGKVLFKSVRNWTSKFSDGGLWMSQVFNNGQFNFYYVLQVHFWAEAADRPEFKYAVEVSVISPDQFSENNRESAKASFCEKAPWDSLSTETQVEMISSYAGGPTVFAKNGNNVEALVKEAREVLSHQGITFGFSMDMTVNGSGTTGWDYLKGDIMAGLDRYRASLARVDKA